MAHDDWPVIRKGNTDEDAFGAVTVVQHLLNAHGARVAVDGIFGSQTEGAVRDVQRSQSVAVDGIVGNQTWPVLVIEVRSGSRGDAVRAVQSAFPALDVDGFFGPRTDQAVREFQEMFGLTVDGVVDSATWLAIVVPKSE